MSSDKALSREQRVALKDITDCIDTQTDELVRAKAGSNPIVWRTGVRYAHEMVSRAQLRCMFLQREFDKYLHSTNQSLPFMHCLVNPYDASDLHLSEEWTRRASNENLQAEIQRAIKYLDVMAGWEVGYVKPWTTPLSFYLGTGVDVTEDQRRELKVQETNMKLKALRDQLIGLKKEMRRHGSDQRDNDYEEPYRQLEEAEEMVEKRCK